jgi:hypothetical protein
MRFVVRSVYVACPHGDPPGRDGELGESPDAGALPPSSPDAGAALFTYSVKPRHGRAMHPVPGREYNSGKFTSNLYLRNPARVRRACEGIPVLFY